MFEPTKNEFPVMCPRRFRSKRCVEVAGRVSCRLQQYD